MSKKDSPPARVGPPQVPPDVGIELLERLVKRAEELNARQGDLEHSDIHAFNDFARTQMERALGAASPSIDSVLHTGGGVGFWIDMSRSDRQREYHGQLVNKLKLLRSCIDTLRTDVELAARSKPAVTREARSPLETLERLANRFHLVARQLRDRQRSRQAYTIADEYDVQDLLHALLRLEFDDVRPEENTPSYAGGSSRMDFLLKSEQVVVEAKCTREGLGAKEVGKQLIEDIAKYRQHSDCKTLVCFVYDPEGRISNPRGLERDLSREHDGLPVQVFIRPS